jgi:hypothetical protein
MDSLVGIVFILGGILVLAGSLMIVIEAFKISFWWGLAVLFIPLAGLVFVVMNWREGRNGAYILILGTLLSGVAFYGGADRELELGKQLDKANVDVDKIPIDPRFSELLEQRPTMIEVPNEEAAQAQGIDTEKDLYEIEAEQEEAPLVIPLIEEAKKAKPAELQKVPMAYQPVSRKRLPEYQGSSLRVHTIDGRDHEGVLVEVSDYNEAIYLSQKVASGDVTYEYPFAKIEWIEVYAEVGKVPVPEDEQPAADEITPRFLPEGKVPDDPEPATADQPQVEPADAPAPPASLQTEE